MSLIALVVAINWWLCVSLRLGDAVGAGTGSTVVWVPGSHLECSPHGMVASWHGRSAWLGGVRPGFSGHTPPCLRFDACALRPACLCRAGLGGAVVECRGDDVLDGLGDAVPIDHGVEDCG